MGAGFRFAKKLGRVYDGSTDSVSLYLIDLGLFSVDVTENIEEILMNCTLCNFEISNSFFKDEKRLWTYWECPRCDYVFRDPDSLLNSVQEKARYATHNNSIEQPGYVNFLQPAVESIKKFVPAGAVGLDFGCGPGPTLSELLRRDGFGCEDYDPLFFPDDQLLQNPYPFVTCTEVVEHFYKPLQDFEKINDLLISGGWLVIMTDHRKDDSHFAQWGYRTDPTHVGFFNHKTWEWIGENFRWKLHAYDNRLAVFQKL